MRGYTDKGAEYSINDEMKNKENHTPIDENQLRSEIFDYLDNLKAGDPRFLERYAKETLHMRVQSQIPSLRDAHIFAYVKNNKMVKDIVDAWEKSRNLDLIDMGKKVSESMIQSRINEDNKLKEKEYLDRLIESNGGKLVKFSIFDHISSIFDRNKAEYMRIVEAENQRHYDNLNYESARIKRMRKLEADVNDVLVNGSNEKTDAEVFAVSQVIKFLNS